MPRNYPTPERLHKLLAYDPFTGVIHWKVSQGTRRAGSIAGSHDTRGHIQIKIDKTLYLAHRLIFLLMGHSLPEQVDHINHIRDDNRWANLRPADYSINSRNISLPCSNRSGRIGVSFHIGHCKWGAYIGSNPKQHLGYYDTKEAAAEARSAAEKELGYHPNHGI